MKKRILLFTDWYYPAFKAGGPIRSCTNLVQLMQGEFEFYVFTSNSDIGERDVMPSVATGIWSVGKFGEQIYYCDPKAVNLSLIKELAQELKPQAVYFNSMFSYNFTLKPLWLLKRTGYRGKVVLAPRGMLHEGAIKIKKKKKLLFLSLFRFFRLQKGVTFHATDEREVQDITYRLGATEIALVNNIPGIGEGEAPLITKKPGVLKLVCISRLTPKKNLMYFLELLKSFSGPGQILFDIYGESENAAYTDKCVKIATEMPSGITVKFHAALTHEMVADTLRKYHLFVLPTLGENFGHAIYESLYNGVPVLISDQTPWKCMKDRNAGWELPLAQPGEFMKAVINVLNMDQEDWKVLSDGARAVAEEYMNTSAFFQKYRNLFQ